MGNVVVWKPSEKQAFAAQLTMDLFRAAGLPDGVINLVHGDGALVSDVAMADRRFAGLHFTGSTTVFRALWKKTASAIDTYRSYPADRRRDRRQGLRDRPPLGRRRSRRRRPGPGGVRVPGAEVLGGQPRLHPLLAVAGVRDQLVGIAEGITVGDVADLSTFCGAVIDEVAYRPADGRGRRRPGTPASRCWSAARPATPTGWFVDPTVLVTDDPMSDTMVRELFGPVLTVHVYDDARWTETLDIVDATSPYALTGAVFATDRAAVDEAMTRLRNAAGNFYVNDKPTGAVVGQQPFGGGRASGTNDKAGAAAEPAALGESPLDQGDLRPADGLALPPPGALARAPSLLVPEDPRVRQGRRRHAPGDCRRPGRQRGRDGRAGSAGAGCPRRRRGLPRAEPVVLRHRRPAPAGRAAAGGRGRAGGGRRRQHGAAPGAARGRAPAAPRTALQLRRGRPPRGRCSAWCPSPSCRTTASTTRSGGSRPGSASWDRPSVWPVRTPRSAPTWCWRPRMSTVWSSASRSARTCGDHRRRPAVSRWPVRRSWRTCRPPTSSSARPATVPCCALRSRCGP